MGRLLSLGGPVSIYADRELDYLLLHESVRTIGADRVRRGLGYDGNGVGVAVIDSGVDGTNRDVRYPGRLVQNVKGGEPRPWTGGDRADHHRHRNPHAGLRAVRGG